MATTTQVSIITRRAPTSLLEKRVRLFFFRRRAITLEGYSRHGSRWSAGREDLS